VTDQPKIEELSRLGKVQPTAEPGVDPRRTNSQVIEAGLEYVFSQRRGRHWGPFGSEKHVTACVLARLGELPSQYLRHSLRQQMLESVDWLNRARTPEGGWGSPSQGDDAETTAWALIALWRHGHNTPEQALSLMRRCRRLDGGFARFPETKREGQGSPEVTALAVRALGTMDDAVEDFLASFLFGAASGIALRPASSYLVCAEILDCETGIASPLLMNQAARVAAQLGKGGPMEQALLLRCLLRLRNQKAWPLAANLRAMQMQDGSWRTQARGLSHDSQLRGDDAEIITTATTVSALVLAEFQPGHYFGSDQPSPRRLQES
jgi:hypothetical protein